MFEIIMEWPLVDRIVAGAVLFCATVPPMYTAWHLEQIRRQNDVIVGLLADIKIGRREL